MRQIEVGKDEVLLALSDVDLVMLIGAIRETSEALPNRDEFITRTGVTPEQMDALQESLSELLKGLQP